MTQPVPIHDQPRAFVPTQPGPIEWTPPPGARIDRGRGEGVAPDELQRICIGARIHRGWVPDYELARLSPEQRVIVDAAIEEATARSAPRPFLAVGDDFDRIDRTRRLDEEWDARRERERGEG